LLFVVYSWFVNDITFVCRSNFKEIVFKKKYSITTQEILSRSVCYVL